MPTLNSYALVAYLQGPLADFVDNLRRVFTPGCTHRAHITLLPPRPLTDGVEEAMDAANGELGVLPSCDRNADACVSPTCCISPFTFCTNLFSHLVPFITCLRQPLEKSKETDCLPPYYILLAFDNTLEDFAELQVFGMLSYVPYY